MDIKKSYGLISIAILVSVCYSGSGSTEGMTELCLKDALAGGPASVMVETYDRRYHREIGPRIRSCVVSHYCGDTTIEPLARVWPIDVATAAASVWHFARYEIAPKFRRWEIGEGLCTPDKDFSNYSPGKFNIGDVASTNISLHVFPFMVKNPASKNTLFCCRVSLMGPNGFICALYVNLNTGDIDMTFGDASGHLPLVVRESQYPFLYEDEIAKQEKFIERTGRPVSKKKRREELMRENDVDRKVNKWLSSHRHTVHHAQRGYCRFGLTGLGEILEYSFGRTNYCDNTAFEVLEGSNKFLCVTNSITHITKDFDVATLYHDAKSRRLFRVSVSRPLPDNMSIAERTKFLNSISKDFDYRYKINVPIPSGDDIDALMKKSRSEWSAARGDDSFLITLVLSVPGNNSMRVTMTVESKQVRHPIKRRTEDTKDVEVEVSDL